MRIFRLMIIPLSMLVTLLSLTAGIALYVGKHTNGQMIAYRWIEYDFADIFMMDLQRRFSVNISTVMLEDNQAAISDEFTWSPDGRYLAVMTQNQTSYQMFFTILDLYKSEPILQTEAFTYSPPEWHPTNLPGILFNIRSAANDWDVYAVTTNSQPQPFLDGHAHEMLPKWSPDGRWLAYLAFQESSFDLYIVDSQGENPKKLTTNINDYDWSPDSTMIAFYHSVEGQSDIFVVNVKTGEITNLTQHASHNTSPLWSPDGTQIAFFSNRGDSNRYYLMNADGSNVRLLVDQEIFTPDWSPDDRYISYVAANINQVTELFMVDVVTGEIQRLTHTGGYEYRPLWRP